MHEIPVIPQIPPMEAKLLTAQMSAMALPMVLMSVTVPMIPLTEVIIPMVLPMMEAMMTVPMTMVPTMMEVKNN